MVLNGDLTWETVGFLVYVKIDRKVREKEQIA